MREERKNDDGCERGKRFILRSIVQTFHSVDRCLMLSLKTSCCRSSDSYSDCCSIFSVLLLSLVDNYNDNLEQCLHSLVLSRVYFHGQCRKIRRNCYPDKSKSNQSGK